MNFIAHVSKENKEIQTVRAHLLGVKKLAENFGKKINLAHVAGLAGVLHDLGKYSDEFQEYIKEVAFNPENTTFKRGDVDHSTAGGRLVFKLFHGPNTSHHEKLLAEIVGNVIISHHSNLHDYISPEIKSDFLRRVDDKDIFGYEECVDRFYNEVMDEFTLRQYAAKAVEELKAFMNMSPSQNFFLTKYIFSCLIDADRTDTRWFEENKIEEPNYQSERLFVSYLEKLEKRLESYKKGNQKPSPINVLRQEMSDQSEKYARKESGVYTLSIPTGGGKTLASLRYALRHAIEFQKKRIIYIVPFTTIIEQNAQEIREILEDEEHILEHHSNVIEEESNDEGEDNVIHKRNRLRLARDNWDSPIIFTTMVQFLNVFYAKSNRNTRRLHNLTESVIIFDEVQKVPVRCISLFNEALNFLKSDGKCSILLCTATQPTLENVKHKLIKASDGEIVSDLPRVTKAFKRVEIIDKTKSPVNNDELAEWIISNIQEWGNMLVILNTKSVVKKLYEHLKLEGIPVYHLSTSMCAAHRKKMLEVIRNELATEMPFVCVTTQLIEAGVDVSFKCVIRSLAGLDSIAQAAGRCNRHGEVTSRPVYVVDHRDEKLSRLKEIEIGKDISKRIFARYQMNPEKYENSLLSSTAINEYFLHYYKKMETELNYYLPKLDIEMTKLLMGTKNETPYPKEYMKYHQKSLPLFLTGSYRTAAESFQVIQQETRDVIVPYGDGKNIILQLNSAESISDLSKLLKKAQQYTVSLYVNEFNDFRNENAIVPHLDGLIYELKSGWYNPEFGTDKGGESGGELIVY